MEKLTNEEIARVFAMYWGCRLDAGMITKVDSFWMNKVSNGETDTVLLLTPLSKITDEHAIEVAELCGVDPRIKTKSERLIKFDDLYQSLTLFYKPDEQGWFELIEKRETNVYCSIPYPVYLNLLQQGYAVPLFFGLNHWANAKTPIELGLAIESL